MDIVHITSEMAPIAKVGGLGDAVYGLAQAEARLGKRVAAILPKYKSLSTLKAVEIAPRVWKTKLDLIDLYLIDHPNLGSKIYGEPNDTDRFGLFCQAAAALIERLGPQIVHLHDWHAAMTALFPLKAKIIFTIHNLQHQGRCAPHNLENVGLDSKALRPLLQDPIHKEALNLMKGAIVNADIVTTVSPSYLEEIQTPEGGFGLDLLLRSHREKLHGILNGIDTEYWNPAQDPHLVERFGENLFQAKAENKRHLIKRFGLSQGFLMAIVTRLVPQKDPDAIEMGIRYVIQAGGQVILLGSAPDPEIQARFEALEAELKPSGRAAFHFGFDEPLAHLVYAAADSIFVPSLFEPCGLTQMIGMRYGAVPIVRATGGLKDTVTEGENGFTFESSEEMEDALKRAMHLYQSDPAKWKTLTLKGADKNYSWENSARKYLALLGLC